MIVVTSDGALVITAGAAGPPGETEAHSHDADYEPTGAVDAHAADTTDVHGIADTAALETTSGAQARVDAHEAQAAPHAGHETPAGAQAKVDAEAALRAAADGALDGRVDAVEATLPNKADLVGGVIPTSQIPAVALSTYLGAVASEAAMLALVGQPGDWATRTDIPALAILSGNDPTLVASWQLYEFGGTGGVASVDGDAGPVVVLPGDGAAGTATKRSLGTGATQAAAGNDPRLSDARIPTAHATSHEPDGTDAMAVDAAAGVGSLRTLGAGATQAAAGNDARLSDARTPTAHAVDGALHTAVGLTAGHVMRATAAAAFGFGAIQDADLPATIARDSEVTTAVDNHAAAADPHTGYQRESEKDANSGYAGLAAAQGTRDGTKFLRDDGTWAAAGGGGVTDGDKGDITVSGGGATWNVDDGAITLAKLADIATAHILGRTTAGTGDPEALTAAQVKALLAIVAADVSDFDTQVASTAILQSLVDAAGDLLVGTADNTVGRLAKGNALEVLRVNAGATALEWAAPAGGSAELLAAIAYAHATVDTSVTTTSTTAADVDATNLAVTFTAPASGIVLVDLNALCFRATGGFQCWGLREGTSDIVAPVAITGSDQSVRLGVTLRLSGVSAGSHTYKWSWRQSASGTSTLRHGPLYGPALMRVWTA